MKKLIAVAKFVYAWRMTALVLIGVFALTAWYLWPQRTDRRFTEDRSTEFQGKRAPKILKAVWEDAKSWEGALKELKNKGNLGAPRFAHGDTALYFTFKPDGGNTRIYVSQKDRNGWAKPIPVDEIKPEAGKDDTDPTIVADGQEMYFSSNRAGARGFDLYCSKWIQTKDFTGWGPPEVVNGVNSSGNDLEPALSRDRLWLYFASDRADRKEGRYQIYVCRREKVDEPWDDPVPVAAVNRPGTNSRSPFVSKTDAFLYFASDRPNSSAPTTNFDVYRSHRDDGTLGTPENLGPTVNSAANDMSPALPDSESVLMFASNRTGVEELFGSQRKEILEEVEYDSSRLSRFMSLAWKFGLLLLSTAVLGLLIWLTYGWIFEKMSAARFLLASLLLHLLILLIMFYATVLQEAFAPREIDSGPVPSDVVNPSSTPQSYEMVGDLAGVSSAAATPMERASASSSAPTEVPRVEMAAAGVPATRPTLFLPAEFAPRDQGPSRELSQTQPLSRRTLPGLGRVAEVKTVDTPSAQGGPKGIGPRAADREMASGRSVSQPRTATNAGDAAAATAASPSSKTPTQVQAPPVDVTPVKVHESGNVPVEPIASAPSPLSRQRVDPGSSVARVTPENVPTPSLKQGDTTGKSGEPAPDKVALAVDRSGGGSEGPARSAIQSSAPSGGSKSEIGTLRQQLPAAEGEAAPKFFAQNNPLARSTAGGRTVAVDLPKVDLPAAVAKAPAPGGIDAGPPAVGDLGVPRANIPSSKSIARGDGDGPDGGAPQAEQKPLVVARAGRMPDARLPGGDPSIDDRLAEGIPRRTFTNKQIARLNTLEGFYQMRTPDMRQEAVKKFGGTRDSEDAVELGLKWLSEQQHEDGRWKLDKLLNDCPGAAATRSDFAATGLALLPFLGAGYAPESQSKYSDTVARGIKWLIDHQGEDGGFGVGKKGLGGGSGATDSMYGHGLCSIAMCEAYALTRDPKLKDPAQKALDFIVYAQATNGGWRYAPKMQGDNSVSGWQVMAIRSGMTTDLKLPPETLENYKKKFLPSVESPQKPGHFGYTSGGQLLTLTAQALLSLQLTGTPRDDPRLLSGADFILNTTKTNKKTGSEVSYFTYHATQVMFHLQGKYWETWNANLRDSLVSTQVKTGPAAGSWTPNDAYESRGGRIYSTSLRLLMLEVYYRHLPLYQELARP